MNYKVIIFYDEKIKGYVVDVPELNGCMSQGKTIDDALINIKDAIKGWLAVEKKHRRPSSPKFREMLLGEVTV
jgi:predicted RNase H-like HicB family nuclease